VKSGLDLIARYPPTQKLPTSDNPVLSFGQPRDRQVGGQRRIHVTLGAYIAPNVARIQAWMALGLHKLQRCRAAAHVGCAETRDSAA